MTARMLIMQIDKMVDGEHRIDVLRTLCVTHAVKRDAHGRQWQANRFWVDHIRMLYSISITTILNGPAGLRNSPDVATTPAQL